MTGTPIRIEAEDMLLSGYRTEDFSSLTFASGKAYTSLFGQGETEIGIATTQFTGPAGEYDIVVAYFDESDGVSQFNITKNGEEISDWLADSTGGGIAPSAQSLVRRTIPGISLANGDTIQLTGIEDDAEAARIDYIELIPIESTDEETTGEVDNTTGEPDTTDETDATGSDTTASDTAGAGTIRVEAESMTLRGYRTESNSDFTFASGNSYASLFEKGKAEKGIATTFFTGETGTYDVVIAYFDEDDGVSKFKFKQNGKQTDIWDATNTTGGSGPSAQSLVRRTLSGLTIKNGDRIQLVGSEGDGEAARIDYIEFVPSNGAETDNTEGSDTGDSNEDPDTTTGEPNTPTAFRIEAEDMTLSGYRTEDSPSLTFASGNAYTSLFSQGETETGTATTQFNGATGTYDIVVAYFDEDDGISKFNLTHDGVEIDDWEATNTTGGIAPSAQSLVLRTLSNIQLTNGKSIQLTGTEDGGEAARIDYIEFIPSSNSEPPTLPDGPLAGSNGILEIMPLGDSITRGEDAQTSREQQNGYRDNLAQKLNSAGISFDFVGSLNNGSGFDTDHEGHGGWKIAQLADSVNGWLESFKPEVILLKIGTNDMGFSTTTVSSAVNQLNSLVDTIIAKRPAAKLIVSSIAPVNPSRFSNSSIVSGFQQRVAAYNAEIPDLVASKVTQGKNVRFADIFGALNSNQDISSDGFHPTESGYEKIANVLLNTITDTPNPPTDNGGDDSPDTNPEDSTPPTDNTDQEDSTPPTGNTDPEEPTDPIEPDTEATGYTRKEGNNLYGSGRIDTIVGTSANELIQGGQRDDILTGGGGSDTFAYDRPKVGLDLITDFGSDDFIRINASKFGNGLQAGVSLSTSESKTGVFVSGDEPISLGTKGTFLFDTTSNILSYDRDGTRTRHSPIEIAKLAGFTDLSADQFIIA